VAELERLAAALTDKDEALFLPSGTMANLATDLPRRRVIAEQAAHLYNSDGGGLSVLAGVVPRPIKGEQEFGSQFLVEPAALFQVQAVSVVKSDAFLFQQVPLEGVAAIAGQAIGHLALGVDDAVPRDLGYRVKALKHAANKAGAPRQAGHRRDLAIGCNPAQRDAADYGTNSFDGFIAMGLGSLTQLALR
jgi:hypothetical protein